MEPARLHEQVIHYRPLAAGRPYTPDTEVFARFGGGSKILCADGAGHAAVYDAEEQSFVAMPAMNSPKGWGHFAFSVSVPLAAARRSDCKDVLSTGEHSDSVYVLDMTGGKFTNASCFEELAYRGGRDGWRWRPLPPPPFLRGPEFDVPRGASPKYAVVGGGGTTRICVSTGPAYAFDGAPPAATYTYDVASREWSKAGDWALQFLGRGEHVPELGVWIGLSSDIYNPYGIYAVDLTGSAFAGGAPPTAQHVGLDLDPPPPEPKLGDPEWLLEDNALVNLGSGRFCVARFFNHYYEQYTPAMAVLTGVEVVPSGGAGGDGRQSGDHGGLSLIRHKSQYIMTDGATTRVL
ncbi:hypothetical protein BAE44_0011412 [Dichanthelium oligosanthes]|uniref:F-box/kelch-repeat protein n=1 Tax=Dichanthelium oligosanthes TaxID=888268 RepID=A0A1E5VR20_9POAL|nr:hypothetical protein BAE44_0011412 [Dichanthelium oligosanthes]